MLHDRDSIFSRELDRQVTNLGVRVLRTPVRAPRAKGRVERNFGTAQDRLVKGMRVEGIRSIEQANEYLHHEYLAWWERELTVEPASVDDAHRALEKNHNLAASLSHVEAREVRPDYTLRWEGKLYRIERRAVTPGLRKADVRVEQRLDGSLAVRHRDQYLPVQQCVVATQLPATGPTPRTKKRRSKPAKSNWMKNFHLKSKPGIQREVQTPGPRRAASQ